MREVVLVVAVVFTLTLAGLTVGALVKSGPDPLTVLSLLVIALFGFGVIGALRNPPGG
jgi:hypothetical protein